MLDWKKAVNLQIQPKSARCGSPYIHWQKICQNIVRIRMDSAKCTLKLYLNKSPDLFENSVLLIDYSAPKYLFNTETNETVSVVDTTVSLHTPVPTRGGDENSGPIQIQRP